MRATGSGSETPAQAVEAVDTTAAGDTFIGYFLAELLAGEPTVQALTIATKAAALCVTRPGAAVSIPAPQRTWPGVICP